LCSQEIAEARKFSHSKSTHTHDLAPKDKNEIKKEVFVRMEVGQLKRVHERDVDDKEASHMPYTKLVDFFLEAQWEDGHSRGDGSGISDTDPPTPDAAPSATTSGRQFKQLTGNDAMWRPAISLSDHWMQNVPIINKSEWYRTEDSDERSQQWSSSLPAHVNYRLAGTAVISHPQFRLTKSTQSAKQFNAVYETPQQRSVLFRVGDEIRSA
jgi:hypothetical protein